MLRFIHYLTTFYNSYNLIPLYIQFYSSIIPILSIGDILEIYWRYIGDVLEMYWRYIGDVIEIYWRCNRDIIEIY